MNIQLQNNDYKKLIAEIGAFVVNSKQKIMSSVNTVLVETYWNIGKYIVEFEQKGEKRAEYGKELLKNISKDLNNSFGKGFSERNIKYMRDFYNSFPHLDFQKRQSVIAKLSWTHIIRLLSIRDENERSFYMIETVENSWSVRELDRQINSCIYERLAISKDKEGLLALSKKGIQPLTTEQRRFQETIGTNFIGQFYPFKSEGVKIRKIPFKQNRIMSESKKLAPVVQEICISFSKLVEFNQFDEN